jgi:hypothetical protein
MRVESSMQIIHRIMNPKELLYSIVEVNPYFGGNDQQVFIICVLFYNKR